MSPRIRRSLPLALAAIFALGTTGCSSSDAESNFGPGPGAGYGSAGGDDDDANDQDPSEPAGDSGSADDGGSDGGGELPPAPDDDGVDNGSLEEPAACDTQTDVTLYLSPDDSNSMSSPVQVREAVLGEWAGVQSVAIRTWEFFNYYTFGYAPAEAGTLAIVPSLAPGELEGEYLLQIGIASEHVDDAQRKPIDVTLVLDTSGSMAGVAMDMLQESSRAIAASLREGDTVSIVTWSTDDAAVLAGHVVDGPNDALLLGKIDALQTGGGTDLHGGLVAGYELAQQVYGPGRINRVVLISDGGANAGITDIDLIAQMAGSNGDDGIYMVGVGVGDALQYNDDLMDLVTDAGKGASVFIADADEAWSVFHDDFISTMSVAARDVQVRLDLPPGFEIVSTSAEEASTDISDVDPQHLAPNDAMVFHQRIRTCAPELLADDTTITVAVRYLDAVTFEPREVEVTLPMVQLLGADPAPLLKGAAVFTYAESLKAYKRADSEGRAITMSTAFAALERAEVVLPGDPELAEIRDVLEALAG